MIPVKERLIWLAAHSSVVALIFVVGFLLAKLAGLE